MKVVRIKNFGIWIEISNVKEIIYSPLFPNHICLKQLNDKELIFESVTKIEVEL